MLCLCLEGRDRIRFLSAVSDVQKMIPHEHTSHKFVISQKVDVMQCQQLLTFELKRFVLWITNKKTEAFDCWKLKILVNLKSLIIFTLSHIDRKFEDIFFTMSVIFTIVQIRGDASLGAVRSGGRLFNLKVIDNKS